MTSFLLWKLENTILEKIGKHNIAGWGKKPKNFKWPQKFLTGTLMQIWKSPYSKSFAFLFLGILELFTRKISIFLKKQATF